jgi:hypothetical protein
MRSVRPWLVVVALAATSACFSQHDPGVVETRSDDCITCHRTEYEQAGVVPLGSFGCTTPVIPVHSPTKPTTCAGCHPSTSSWCPAVDGIHPEAEFPIASGRHDVPCASCHSVAALPFPGGENTDCIGCHMPDGDEPHSLAKMNSEHDEESRYPAERDDPARVPPNTDANFCLSCHPRGRN